MQTMLPKIRTTQPIQIQLTSGLTWIWSVAVLVSGFTVPTMR